MGTLRIVCFTIVGVAFLAFLYPLKVYVRGIPWNELPPLAWKALPRTVLDGRTAPARTFSVFDDEDFRLAYWAWITRERKGWCSEKTLYPPGLFIIADTVRLNLLPDRRLAVFIYRAPVADGTGIEFVKTVPPEEMAGLLKEAERAQAGAGAKAKAP